MAYATVAELSAHIAPTTVPATAARLLERASRDVDRALRCAIYPVDDDGLPTETEHVAALRDATLEQAVYRMALGDTGAVVTGIPGGLRSVKIGSLSLEADGSSGGITAGAAAVPLGDDARQVLEVAGLTGQQPMVW